ncbi:hypothetical protein [Meiothermus sp.]|uniref:hypothetical protein n=1 Tax=Meiothermus sp. TaxID=1955249 RepID=UPI0021DECB21|nr:hypothetical protein [Meiothermus sp.]GIW32855.1 MAG: hypothetical protein KatS3mg072_0188 [Meiothermus sp.]
MKLQLPETLLTQTVETPSGTAEGIPLKPDQLDPVLTEAVESQPEQPEKQKQPEQPTTKKSFAQEPQNAKEEKAKKHSGKGKSLPLVGIALAALAAVIAVASQGTNYGSNQPPRAEQPHAPQPAGGNRGIIWE